jgi:hypothetical protein
VGFCSHHDSVITTLEIQNLKKENHMRTLVISLAAGAVLVSTCALVRANPPTVAPVPLAKDKDHDKAAKDEANAARAVIAQAVDHAVAGDLRSLLKENVGQRDRDRIEKELNKSDEDKFREAADRFRGEWKKRYGSEFNAAEHSRFANAFDVDQGKDESHLDVKIAGTGAKDTLYLHLHREKLGEWKIALPDSMSGDKFASDMVSAMDHLRDMKNLPNSVDEAYRATASEVLRPLQYSK